MLEAHGIEVDLQITNKCPLTCDHCVYDSRITEPSGLPISLIENLCDEFAALHVDQVSITGGEPFLRKDLCRIVEMIAGRGMEVCVQTSGLLAGKADMLRLKSAGLQTLLVSIDGHAEYHNSFRHRPGLHQDTLQTIARAKHAGLTTRINSVVTRSNLQTAAAMLDVADEQGVDVLSFFYFSPVGRGARFPQEVLSFSQWRDFQASLQQWSRRHPDSQVRIKAQNVATELGKLDVSGQRCRIPNRDNILILANGDVYPCVFLSSNREMALGNVHTSSLQEIWRGSLGWTSTYGDLLRTVGDERDCGCGQNPRCSGGCPAFRMVWQAPHGVCDRRCEWSSTTLVPSCAREYVLVK